jgi:hypothetical protein
MYVEQLISHDVNVSGIISVPIIRMILDDDKTRDHPETSLNNKWDSWYPEKVLLILAALKLSIIFHVNFKLMNDFISFWFMYPMLGTADVTQCET